ncbi:fimbria/pilus outer membrane usher protein [Variovorax sp. OV329]|uniref:fimbria/pilus outer membrane usher protein n=1 Tax=Variovorax sp. OV329 TaxID=1882825 RepID=UPI0008ED11EA|nr:fimbria/pilus outer membrane usher protein [Variovorax sp. OV329]SFN28497.1 outer membrane usher protein [Variovorax sp. OV329]
MLAQADLQRLAGARGSELILDLTLNGNARGLVQFGLRDGELWADAATLRDLGFVLPPGSSDPVRLNSLRGVDVRYSAQRQTVEITASAEVLRQDRTVVNTNEIPVPDANASPGLLLNYDLYGTKGERNSSSMNAFTELRAFTGKQVFSSTFLTQGTQGQDLPWSQHSVRLDTTWSRSFPDDMVTLRVGDTNTAALAWSRSTLIGGVQLSRNFALQPYRTTTPIPAFLGSAALPSQVEVFVNGMKQYTGQLPSGPFQLNTVPGIGGAGNAQVVLTDAFGRSTTLDYSLYDVQQRMLQQGLSDWSVDIGAVRENYGYKSNDYGSDPAASGTWRYGLTNTLTVETHAESTRGLVNAGGSAVYMLGNQLGIVTAGAAQSSYDSRQGSLFNMGYSWRDQRFNFQLEGTRTNDSYRDVASLYGAPVPDRSGRASVGYGTDLLGSFGLSYLYLRYPNEVATRYATAYWSRSIGQRGSLNVSFNRDLNDNRNSSVFVGISWYLDGNISTNAGVQRDDRRTIYTADAQHSAPNEGGWGWRAGAQTGDADINGGAAEVNYLGRYGRALAGVNAFGSSRYAYAGATGSLVFMGGQPFAARRLDDGFAVVSTDGMPNVPVKLENRLMGSTDAKGMLLVTPLQSYQVNQLSIDPMQLPADVRVDRVRTVATPTDRAGTLVEFGIRPVQAAALILVDEKGEFLPLGSSVRANGKGGMALVGYDGAAYLDTLEEHNTLEVRTPTGVCVTRFDFRKSGNGIPQIGPLKCVKESSR